MTTETLEQKTEYWNDRQAKTQTKKIELQFQKTETENGKMQKRKTIAYYDGELLKIRAIQDAIEHLCELERNF